MNQSLLYKKKGQMAGNAVGNIIALIVGIGVSVLVLIFIGSLGGQTYNLLEDDIDKIGNNIIKGELFTVYNTTTATTSLDHGFIQTGSLSVYNTTDSAIVGLNNFTIDYDAGSISAINNFYNNTQLGANYTWGAKDVRIHVKAGLISSFEALEETGNYLPIIVLAVVISLVLALVLGMTFIGRPGGGSAL